MTAATGADIVGHSLGFTTEHFLFDSRAVGDSFSIAVTAPARRRGDLPVIYAADAHTNSASTTAAAMSLMGDRLRPVAPFVLVTIGYADNDFAASLTRRNRDFVPPDEPVPAALERHVRTPSYAQALGGAEGVARFMDQARHGRADRFLEFLEQELHPDIAHRFAVSPRQIGLFGHSFGGLFSLYALTSGSALFETYCAASPALITDDSTITQRWRALAADRPLDLYVTLSELEMTGPYELYRILASNTVRFLDDAARNPSRHVRLSSSVVPDETHYSTVYESFRRFVRFSYPERTAP
ncbi:alpha/beta hydrolase [Gordonia sp. NPDC003424]